MEEIIIGVTVSTTNWTNQPVKVTLPAQSGYTAQYQINSTSGEWIDYTEQIEVVDNSTVHYRYNDGTQIGNYGSKTINNIDTTIPEINTDINVTNVNTNSFSLNLAATDTESGIAKIVWYYKISSQDSYTSVEEVYTELNGATAGETGMVTETLELSSLNSSSTYSVYAEIYNVAGGINPTSTITVNTLDAVAQVGTTNYASVNLAIDSIESTGTVLLLMNTTEDVTVPTGKDITLNTNSKTITGVFTNNGTCNINGNGTLTSSAMTINNFGTLTIDNTTISSTTTAKELIETRGKLTINSGTITSQYTGILNFSNLILKGGTYNTKEWYVLNQAGGVVEVSGGEYTSTNNNGLINYGEATINGSALLNSCRYQTVYNKGTLNFEAGTIKASTSYAIDNFSICNMTGGTIETGGRGIMNDSGAQLTITGGSIIGTNGLPIDNYATCNISNGTLQCTGGNVIINRADSVLTMTGGEIISINTSNYPAVYNYGTFNGLGGSISAAGYAIYNKGGTSDISDEMSITGNVL